jgi:hypothetical protein
VHPNDLLGSICERMGIDPEGPLPNPLGQDLKVMPDDVPGFGKDARPPARNHVRKTPPMHRYRWLPICSPGWQAPPSLPAQAGAVSRAGYLYPAGACRGTTVEILAGGQNLRATGDPRFRHGVRPASSNPTGRCAISMATSARCCNGTIACRRAELNGRPETPAAKVQTRP